MKKLSAAALVVASLMITTSVASAQAICAPLLLFSAAYIGATQNRELTNREAFWCGLVQETQPQKVVKKKKVAKVKKQKAG